MKYPFEYADGSIENKISYVLSFNYTNTFERVYFKDENIEDYLHFIHGKADINHEMAKTAHENYTKKMKKHNLYIFGHSLDVTDKDILKELILNDNVDTTIFYRNQEQKEQQVANFVKVIGPDELIRKTGGSTRTIVFELQKKPREI